MTSRSRLYFYALIIGLTYINIPAVDPDLGWHLLGGAWIVNHQMLPKQDIINAFRPIWHDYHWLGQIVMYLLYSWGGYQLLSLCVGLIVAYCAKVIVDIVLSFRSTQRHEYLALLYIIFALTILNGIVQVRPQIFSITLLALALRTLLQRKSGKIELPLLTIIAIVLANVHVYWVFVPFLWFVLRCVPRFMQRTKAASPKYAWGGLVILALCGFVSPYGLFTDSWSLPDVLMNYALIYDYMDVPHILRQTVGEFRSPFLISPLSGWILVGMLFLVLRFCTLKRLFALLPYSILFATFIVLSFKAAKYSPLFGIFSLPLLISISGTRLAKLIDKIPYLSRAPVWLVSVLLFVSWRAYLYQPVDFTANDYYPVDMCQHIAALKLAPQAGRDHVRILTHFEQGGWCEWALYQADPDKKYRVTSDNRTQGVPGEHYEASFDLYSVRGNWYKTLQSWDPDVALVPKIFPLGQFMAMMQKDWTLEMQNDKSALFLRKRSDVLPKS
jgi:hypothetical protein